MSQINRKRRNGERREEAGGVERLTRRESNVKGYCVAARNSLPSIKISIASFGEDR